VHGEFGSAQASSMAEGVRKPRRNWRNRSIAATIDKPGRARDSALVTVIARDVRQRGSLPGSVQLRAELIAQAVRIGTGKRPTN